MPNRTILNLIKEIIQEKINENQTESQKEKFSFLPASKGKSYDWANQKKFARKGQKILKGDELPLKEETLRGVPGNSDKPFIFVGEKQ